MQGYMYLIITIPCVILNGGLWVGYASRIGKQINCRASAWNGALISAGPENCRQWQGTYCQGCTLSIIQ
jgi:hypothetical protein